MLKSADAFRVAGDAAASTRMDVRAVALLVAALILATSHPASAYIDPGVGLNVIVAAFASIASLFLTVVGFVLYPLTMLWRALARAPKPPAND